MSFYENSTNIEEKRNAKIKEIKKNNFTLDINIKDIFNNSKIELEEINLIKSLGRTWYKCPNGHPYTVGECGRPMEESVCPECHSRIGGLDHNLDERNTEINFDNNIINNHNNINGNILLNQDDQAYADMNINNEHQMDPEVEEAIRDNPEMNEYN